MATSPSTSPMASTSTSTPNITLRLATRADLPTMAHLLSLSFLDFELHDHYMLNRRHQPQEYYRHLLWRVRTIWATPGHRHIIAEETHGDGTPATPVGFATWEAQGTSTLAAEWRRDTDTWANALERRLLALEGAYVRAFTNRLVDHAQLTLLIADIHHNFEALQAGLHLQYLVTRPGFQGRGVGARLLEWGLRVARERGLPVVLESSLAGCSFYERKGFRVVKWIKIGKEGGRAARYDMPAMLWEPERERGRWLEEGGEAGWRIKERLVKDVQ